MFHCTRVKERELNARTIDVLAEGKNYRRISFLSVVGKIYAGILVDRFRRVTGVLIDDGAMGL